METDITAITTIIFMLISWPHNAEAIIGYDCGAPTTNITTLSLLGIEECDIPPQKVETSKVYIQLLQINEFSKVKVFQCKIEIDRLVKRCGMFSHTMDVRNGKHAYVQEVSRDACIRMHTYGTYEAGFMHITGLKSNQTSTRPITLAGHLNDNGECSGTTYSDPFGTWEEAVVLASIKITLQDYMADVKINTNKVLLRSGVTCELGAAHCTDMEGGNTYWTPLPDDQCKTSAYEVVYQGYADKIINSDNQQGLTVYSITAITTAFALAQKDMYSICGYALSKTEHPKLVISETTPGGATFAKSISTNNMDIFTYMNSKFVYVERHSRKQMNRLYTDLLLQQCQLEKKILHNSLAIAAQSPDIFAYHLMKGPGYMALLSGEVIHIIKCVGVEVKIARTEECYEQLPVILNNQTQFLTPQTHILLQQGTQITCNAFAPPTFLVGDSWYRFTPTPVRTVAPLTMKPMVKPNWKYVNPGSLATSGIYSQSDLMALRDHIMFPAERPAMLNTLARGMMGQPTTMHGGSSFANILDEASVEKIATSAWNKIWSKFLIFGNISAGLLGIYLAARAIKLILDTIVHGYALHTVYGWSVYLLGAIWDSLTQLLLHLKTNNTRKGQQEKYKNNGDTETSELKPINDIEESNPRTPTDENKIYPLLPQKETSFTLELKE